MQRTQQQEVQEQQHVYAEEQEVRRRQVEVQHPRHNWGALQEHPRLPHYLWEQEIQVLPWKRPHGLDRMIQKFKTIVN